MDSTLPRHTRRLETSPCATFVRKLKQGRKNVVHAYAAFPNRVSNDRGLRSTLVEHSRLIVVL